MLLWAVSHDALFIQHYSPGHKSSQNFRTVVFFPVFSVGLIINCTVIVINRVEKGPEPILSFFLSFSITPTLSYFSSISNIHCTFFFLHPQPSHPCSDCSFSESVLLHLWCAAAALLDDHPCDWSDHGLEAEGLWWRWGKGSPQQVSQLPAVP